ncbi:Leucine-rich repeat protein, partial [Coemansia asiatica]
PSLSQPQIQSDVSLRHEVLDKVARRSQPNTPYDPNINRPSSYRPPSSMSMRPVSSMDHPDTQPIYTSEDTTVLPGDSRLRAYMSNQNLSSTGLNNVHESSSQSHQFNHNHHQNYYQQQQQQSQRANQLKSSNSYTSGLNQRQDSASHFGSIRKAELAVLSQVRKTSDSSAHLLTPNDLNGLLPTRVGNMVLDQEIGEWIDIHEYKQVQSHKNSPNSRGNGGHAGNSSCPLVESPLHSAAKGPASGRSSISTISHTSAFPQPLPTNADGRSSTIGMGLISPVENQRIVVREMAERKAARRNSTSQRRPIEDEALGSIVQRLMTPATSPDGCTALDLSGSGIRNLSGLAQLTSRLETICLSGNKLRSLAGLPTGLVSLRAPSNWIRFSIGDADKFSFARELPHLEEIDLSANEIGDISVFSGLRHLRILELNRNRIESLHGLRGCRRLLQLGLRDNIVTSFDLDASETPLLASLDLFNNRLRVIPASIAEFMHLSRVNMVKNDLEQVELYGAPAEAIRELRLSENPLLMRSNSGVVEVGMWQSKYPNLKTLYLDICNIRQLARPAGMLSGNVDVRSKSDMHASSWLSLFNLSLRGNALQPLLAIDFDCLSNLKNLYAPDTHMVLPRSLPTMNHLLQLVLCNAGLSRLPANMGAALPQLKLLDVSNNPELNDPQPILQLAQTLEVLKCRTVGFGDGNIATPGIQTFPDVPNDNNASNSGAFAIEESSNEQNLLKTLSKMRRLRRLDLRFNQCNRDLYAPSPSLVSQALQSAAGTAGAALSLDGALSPQMAGQSGGMSDGSASAVASSSGIVSSARIDEEAWLRQDHAYVHSLKLTHQAELTQRRERYWITAISLFPRLEELDGIKVGPH